MGTMCLECGCSISWSMFGERENVFISLCQGHAPAITGETLDTLAGRIRNLPREASQPERSADGS